VAGEALAAAPEAGALPRPELRAGERIVCPETHS
jgi:hypothetical protein